MSEVNIPNPVDLKEPTIKEVVIHFDVVYCGEIHEGFEKEYLEEIKYGLQRALNMVHGYDIMNAKIE